MCTLCTWFCTLDRLYTSSAWFTLYTSSYTMSTYGLYTDVYTLHDVPNVCIVIIAKIVCDADCAYNVYRVCFVPLCTLCALHRKYTSYTMYTLCMVHSAHCKGCKHRFIHQTASELGSHSGIFTDRLQIALCFAPAPTKSKTITKILQFGLQSGSLKPQRCNPEQNAAHMLLRIHFRSSIGIQMCYTNPSPAAAPLTWPQGSGHM